MRLPLLISCTLLCLLTGSSLAQDDISAIDKITNFPTRFIEKIQKRSAHLEDQLLKKTEKYLEKLAKKEARMYRKLQKMDSAKASVLLAESKAKYDALFQQLKEPAVTAGAASGEYLPYVDSLKGSLSFLNDRPDLLSSSAELKEKINGSLQQFNELQARLKQSDAVKQFIKERKEHLKRTLSSYTQLPAGIRKELDRFNQELYYYSQQIREYRQLLNEPDKLTLRALALLHKVPAFTEFLKKHSELAGLFAVPAGYGSPQGLSGLQTIDQVRQLVINQVGSGPNAMAALQQNLQAAQSQLGQLKDKINQLGGGSGDLEMPNFRPNNEKVKTFWKRLEYGTNLQSTRSSYFFPNSTDIGLSVGYKLSGKSIVGVGMSYRVGWGKDIRRIVVTQEGIGFRSFFDTKIKGSFFASAGFEYNYQQPFNSIAQLQSANNWQQSGLAGITKIISLKSKVFKKTKAQLLWDFLSYSQRPVTQPLKFRIGYNF
jgi:predicted nuclease with TOPRIM domain